NMEKDEGPHDLRELFTARIKKSRTLLSRTVHRRRKRSTAVEEASLVKTSKDDHEDKLEVKTAPKKESSKRVPKATSPLQKAEENLKPPTSDNRLIWAQNLLLQV
ncbi:hypothetical protein KIN20_030183, partial [Parelaphostrongylus tenuis]